MDDLVQSLLAYAEALEGGYYNVPQAGPVIRRGALVIKEQADRIEALEKALREVVVAYDRSFPMRTADAHYNCDCLRCTVDRAEGALK